MDILSTPIFIPALVLLLLRLFYGYNKPQTKKYHPIVGTLFNLLINYHKLHHYMTGLAAKYKTYRLIGPFHSLVYTTEPANVEYILKTNFENYGKGTYTNIILKDFLGDGIFTVDGHKWREQRKVSSNEFSTKILRDFSSVTFKANTIKLGNILLEAANSNRIIDIDSKKDDILSRFLQLNDKDPKYLRDIIVLNFVLAGKDPIGLTMSWFIYMLCKHPEVQDKVSKEIIEATNVKDETTSVADFADRVSEDSLKKMQYLHAALTETIRLYPALPMDPKICFSDDVLPDGFSVKKGDVVAYQPYAMGKMKFLWGDDAHEFKPERWLDHNGCFHPENPYKFTAFQAGPRTCLGQDFAYRQLKIISSVLLGCFMFKMGDENKTPKYKIMINLQIDGGLYIRVSKRFRSQSP